MFSEVGWLVTAMFLRLHELWLARKDGGVSYFHSDLNDLASVCIVLLAKGCENKCRLSSL